jgi:hypothetical protein
LLFELLPLLERELLVVPDELRVELLCESVVAGVRLVEVLVPLLVLLVVEDELLGVAVVVLLVVVEELLGVAVVVLLVVEELLGVAVVVLLVVVEELLGVAVVVLLVVEEELLCVLVLLVAEDVLPDVRAGVTAACLGLDAA